MPFGTITSTSNTFGSISGDVGANVPGTLTGSVGVPGPQGQQGIQGIQGPPGPAGPGSTWGGIAGTLSDQTDLQTALNAKANLAGPVFTGDARAVTPAFGDNDTSIATTAFVQSALLGGTAIARNLEVEVRNQSGVTVPAGSIVYISGATGNKPLITLAQANNDANSAQTIGFVKTAIANNGTGYVIVRGELENIDTSALAEGVQLYLSPTTAGTWTTTKPSAPQHLVYVGICVRSHPTLGTILVAVQNGYELDELHDVQIVSPTNGQVLKYNSTSGLWVNGTDVAPVTSVAGRTGAITLSNTDISGLGTMATASASNYSTTAVADTLYAPIARGLPASGTVGQVLTKQSGTSYDATWQTLVPGDRYLTTSSTSNTIGTGSKTFTVGTGLSYSSQQDVVISFDASNHMHALVTSYNSGTGALVVNVQSVTGSGTYTAWTINVGGTTPLQSVEWGEILGTLGDQTDLATALNAKLEISTAASTYAALAGATFTGEVVTPSSTTSNAGLTITPGVAPSAPQNGEIWATTNDLQIRLNGVTETLAEQSWVTAGFYPLSGNPSGFLTSSALTPYALLSGATFTGLISTPAVTTASAFLRLPHGTAPTTPTNGDVWTTTSGLFARINGGTQQYAPLGSTNTFTGTNTFSGATVSFGTSTAASTINVGTGATLTATTKAINIGTAGVSGSTTNIAIGSATSTTTTTVEGTVTLNGTTLNLGNSTAASTINVGSGGTISGSTKTISIGNNGASGSTTNVNIANTIGAPSGAATINIGVASGPPTTTTNLNGTVNATTAAADTNSTVVATTAYVVGQAGSATPLVNGTAAVGTSLRYARQDHVHPTDTSRAALASPTFTGAPLSTTAAVDTNTTQIATTAYVVGQASAATPLVDGTAAVGTSLRYARADHVHPTDTSRAALNSPAFTGTPSLPTGTTAVTQTAGNNTTAVATTAFVTAAVPAAATIAEAKLGNDTTKFISSNVLQKVVNSPSYYKFPRGILSTNVTGTGAVLRQGALICELVGPSSGAGGSILRYYGLNGVDVTAPGLWAVGSASYGINFGKAFRLTGSVFLGLSTNTIVRVSFGKNANNGVGDPTSAAVGWRYNQAVGFIEIIAHDGSTLKSLTTASNPSGMWEWEIFNDGAGNVQMFVNDVSIGTLTGGRTTWDFASAPTYVEEIQTTATPAAQPYARFRNGGIFLQP